jgi:hypothetical protein|tara:strand:- start:2499 stop:2750 length:252 start_codon:yes stop_codon:yes gene_type:complete
MLNENKILRKNIKDLQEQLVNANQRIKILTDDNYKLKKELNPFDPRNSDSKWAELPNENPDAEHIEEDDSQFKLNLNEDKENE